MKKMFFSFLIFVFLSLTACSTNNNNRIDNNTSNANIVNNSTSANMVNNSTEKITGDNTMNTNVTKEWLQSQFEFTDDDLSEINVEEVAKALWWTQDEVIKEYSNNPKLLLSVMKSAQNQLNMLSSNNSSVSSIQHSSEISEGELPDFSDLATIEFLALSQGEGVMEMTSGLLDITTNKLYYAYGFDVRNILESKDSYQNIEEYDLSEEDIKSLLSSINKTFLVESNKKELWSVTLEYKDGSVYKRSIEDANFDNQKLSMINSFFERMQNKSNGSGFFKLWSTN